MLDIEMQPELVQPDPLEPEAAEEVETAAPDAVPAQAAALAEPSDQVEPAVTHGPGSLREAIIDHLIDSAEAGEQLCVSNGGVANVVGISGAVSGSMKLSDQAATSTS